MEGARLLEDDPEGDVKEERMRREMVSGLGRVRVDSGMIDFGWRQMMRVEAHIVLIRVELPY